MVSSSGLAASRRTPGLRCTASQQLAALLLGLLSSATGVLPRAACFMAAGPLVHEGLDLLVVEIDQRALGQALGDGPHLPVADDAAGEHELVARRAVAGEEVDHPLHHQVRRRPVSCTSSSPSSSSSAPPRSSASSSMGPTARSTPRSR